MHISDLIVLVFIVASVAATIIFRKLTMAGAFTGGLLAALLYKGLGITGIVLLGAFFVAGTLATSLGRRKKEAELKYHRQHIFMIFVSFSRH